MDIQKLDMFSRLMYELFSTGFSELIQFAGNMPGHEETLIIEVASPYGAESKLKISTWNGEITVGFDHARMQFGWSDVPTEAFNEAKDTINSIFNEEWLAGAEITDGKCADSSFFTASQLDDTIRNNPRYNRIVGWNYSYLTEGNS